MLSAQRQIMKAASAAKALGASSPSSAEIPTDESKKKGSGSNKRSKSLPASAARKSRKVSGPGAKKSAKVSEKKLASGAYSGKNDRAAAMAASIGRGVTMRPSGKWQAQLYFAGQSRYIGVFESREKATLAYEIAREILKGDNAPAQPGEAAERAVEAARKAAFDGVNDASDFPGDATTSGSAATPKTPSSTTSTTPSTTTSPASVKSEERNSIRAVKAAEILKGMVGIGKTCSSPEAVEQQGSESLDSQDTPMWIINSRDSLPCWVEQNIEAYGERLVVPEWETSDYRDKNGWKGRDFMHNLDSPVRIVDYFATYGDGVGGHTRGGEGTILTGIVHFTPRAESHQGFCHGGSMTAVMDDVIGWAGFLAAGKCQPWTGFTAQINTSLRKPIPVESWLLVRGRISKIEGRKVTVVATLLDPANNEAVHAEGDGLVILNSGILSSR